MKYFVLTFLIIQSFQGISQCCPYINDIEVIPINPTTTDTVKIVTTVATPNQGQFISSSFAIANDTIFIEACYYSGLATAIQVYTDTLTVGTLPAGDQVVHFTAYQSDDIAVCTHSDTSTSTSNFYVNDGFIGSVSESLSQIGVLYPNPSTGDFTIVLPRGVSATHIRLYDLSGKFMTQLPFTEQFLMTLASGTYFIHVFYHETHLGVQCLSIR